MHAVSDGRVALHLLAQKLFDFRAAVLLAPANSNDDWITMFGGQEEWDRYERSILRKLADEIRIAIRDNSAEMIIYKAI